MASGTIKRTAAAWNDVEITQASTMAVRAKSDGGTILLSIGGSQASTASGSVIATVEAGYRPSVAQWMSCTAILGSSDYAARLLFDTDGTISVYDLPSVGVWSFGGSAVAFL